MKKALLILALLSLLGCNREAARAFFQGMADTPVYQPPRQCRTVCNVIGNQIYCTERCY